jgi:hypothetical protein
LSFTIIGARGSNTRERATPASSASEISAL